MLISGAVFASQTTRNLESFDQLKVTEKITVTLVKGNGNSAEIEIQSGDINDLMTTIDNGILRIFWKKGTGYNRTAKIKLNYTQLKGVYTAAGANVTSKEIMKSKELKITANSGSKMNLNIDCSNLIAEVRSGSSISINGKSKEQKIVASSGASYKAKSLVSETTSAKASSGASVVVFASNTIKAEADSGASIKYGGNPTNKELDESKITGSNISSF